MKTEKCQCWTCKSLSPKLRRFEKQLTPKLLKEFRVMMNELWSHLEADSTDLGVLNSKIEGIWPKQDNEKYYTRINGKLYEIIGKLVKENVKKNGGIECDAEDGNGPCACGAWH